MNKKFFDYLLNSRKSTVVLLSVIYAFSFAAGEFANLSSRNYGSYGFVSALVASIIAAYVSVPLLFGFLQNKKAVDSYFSLPVSRKEMTVTTAVFVILMVSVPFMMISAVGFVMMKFAGSGNILGYLIFLLVYFLSVSAIIIFNSGIFLEANSIIDGVIMMAAYAVMPLLIFGVVEVFFESYVYGSFNWNTDVLFSLSSIIYSVSSGLFECFVNMKETIVSKMDYETVQLMRCGLCMLIHIIIGSISLRFNFVKRKAERAETISDRFFSYPFVIYFYVFALTFMTVEAGHSLITNGISIFVLILIFICFIIANFVYRRKISVSFKDICFFFIAVLIAVSFGTLATGTKGFGLAKKYDRDPYNREIIYYQYKTVDDKSDLNKMILQIYPDMTDYSLDMNIRLDHAVISNNKELIEETNRFRDELIDRYYEKTSDEKRYYERYTYASVNIIDNYVEKGINTDWDSNTRRSYYEVPEDMMFTVDQLLELSKYGNIDIYINTDSNFMELSFMDLYEMTLADE